MLFADLRLAEPILRAITAEGYATPTPVQAQTIPLALAGRDVLACAQTGTGKTAAFALPILHRLSVSSRPAASPRAPRCLVLCPTRELACQIADSFAAYGRNLSLHHATVYGGVHQNPQVAALRRGVDVLIATPGRLMDLMEQGFVDLRAVQTLVLDEADRMLDMGFINDIQRISAKLPVQRQTLLFSATMPAEIRRLAGRLLRDPATVQIAAESSTADHIEQSVYHVERANKPALLTHLLEHKPMHRTIVFTRTRHGADRLVKHLQRTDIGADAIHGDKSQNARKRTLDSFRRGRLHVLVATDVASRGIDVDGITHVVNYDVSMDPESYVHRIGRTARAGASGVAISFCDRSERGQFRAIERLIGRPIPVCDEHPEYPKVSAAPAAQVRHPQSRDANGNTAGHATAIRFDRRQPYPHHAAGKSGGGQAGGGKRKPRRGRSRTGRGAYSTSHA